MMKLILPGLSFMMMIMSCNNQDHAEKKGQQTVEDGNPREKILQDSILKFPDSLIIKEKLVQYYRDASDFDKAIAFTSQALAKDSLNARLWDIKATLYFENEDTVNAIRSFETAFRLNPGPRYLILLGSIYAQTKDSRALLVADALAKTKMPETEKEAFFINGLYLNYIGNKTAAIAELDKCLALDNRHMFAYREKGIALYDMGKFEEAIAVLNKAVNLQNNFDEGHYWLGRSLEKMNKPNEAIKAYKMALLYAPDYVEAEEALTRLGVK